MLFHELKPNEVKQAPSCPPHVGEHKGVFFWTEGDAHDAAYSDWILALGQINHGVVGVVKRQIREVANYLGHERDRVY